MTDFVGDAVGQRMAGGQPSRFRAIGAALIIGAGAMMLAYRLLRSGSDDAGSDDEAGSDDADASADASAQNAQS